MRNFIFEFEQEHMVKLGIKIDELLLIDYFYKFFREGRARYILDGTEKYYLIRYSKITADLPILGGDKTMRRMVAELERKQVLKRYIKGNRDLYVWVNWKRLCNQEDDAQAGVGQSCPPIFNIAGQNGERDGGEIDSSDQPPTQNCPTIDSYNNKKIKIITRACASALDKDLLLREIHKQLNLSMSTLIFDMWYKDARITGIADTFIEFAFPTQMAADVAKRESYLTRLEAAVNKAVGLFTAA